MKNGFTKILISLFIITFSTCLASFGIQQTANKYELIIENNADWCIVEIYGMGKTASSNMVKYFITGKKKQIEKIYKGTTNLEEKVRLVRVSRAFNGSVKVTILRNGVPIGGPWINDEEVYIQIDDLEVPDPWNTKHYYFSTDAACDPSGTWISSSEDAILKLSKGKGNYLAEIMWAPSGDKFMAEVEITGEEFRAKWRHIASQATGTFKGILDEECSTLEIGESSGNFDWSETVWEIERGVKSRIPPLVISLKGDWHYDDEEGFVKIEHLKKNDYQAKVWTTDGRMFKIDLRLMGNIVIANWFEEASSESGSFTAMLRQEGKDYYIEITDSSGTLDWSGIVWIKGKLDI
jgi:hypothetical protein